MLIPITDDMRDRHTPNTVIIRSEAREPIADPTAGVPLALDPIGTRKHRLVTLGDSLTHGFQSGAIYHTELSYPAIIAHELGWSKQFRYPRYGGPGGLPVNIEHIIRRLEDRYGDKLNWWEFVPAALSTRAIMDDIEDYWETGAGSTNPDVWGINHNLGMYGWDLRDAISMTNVDCANSIARPSENWGRQVVENASARAALRVLPSKKCHDPPMSTVDAAEALGADGSGIETLIVFLGANNALGSVVGLDVKWSDDGYDTLEGKRGFTVWRPEHFQKELNELVKRIQNVNAARVIWATVPHVTVAPVARGVGQKLRANSRYFPFYTRPWIAEGQFSRRDPHITGAQARAVDSAIDQYNDAIVQAVRDARLGGRQWFVLDIAGVLDRLAQRRYMDTPAAQPPWWTPYPLPPELDQLKPQPPNAKFFRSGPTGRIDGGLFSLDGVHPTTIAYGIIAQEFMNVMQFAGVQFNSPDGLTARTGPVQVDFKRLIAADTLISNPPRSLDSDLRLIGWLDERLDCMSRWLGRG